MVDMEEIARELRTAHAQGKDAVELALLSKERLSSAFGVISFIASFRLAFNIPLPVLQRAQAWEGFGWGGVQISDEEFAAILSPGLTGSNAPIVAWSSVSWSSVQIPNGRTLAPHSGGVVAGVAGRLVVGR